MHQPLSVNCLALGNAKCVRTEALCKTCQEKKVYILDVNYRHVVTLIGRSYMFLLVSVCGDGLFHALRIWRMTNIGGQESWSPKCWGLLCARPENWNFVLNLFPQVLWVKLGLPFSKCWLSSWYIRVIICSSKYTSSSEREIFQGRPSILMDSSHLPKFFYITISWMAFIDVVLKDIRIRPIMQWLPWLEFLENWEPF